MQNQTRTEQIVKLQAALLEGCIDNATYNRCIEDLFREPHEEGINNTTIGSQPTEAPVVGEVALPLVDSNFAVDLTQPQPATVVLGQQVEKKFPNKDSSTREVNLASDQLTFCPWDWAEAKYERGKTFKGKVTTVKAFGAFVELEPGIEGLVHLSELSPNPAQSVSEIVKPDQEVEVRVLSIEPQNKTLSLSLIPLPVVVAIEPFKSVDQSKVRVLRLLDLVKHNYKSAFVILLSASASLAKTIICTLIILAILIGIGGDANKAQLLDMMLYEQLRLASAGDLKGFWMVLILAGPLLFPLCVWLGSTICQAEKAARARALLRYGPVRYANDLDKIVAIESQLYTLGESELGEAAKLRLHTLRLDTIRGNTYISDVFCILCMTLNCVLAINNFDLFKQKEYTFIFQPWLFLVVFPLWLFLSGFFLIAFTVDLKSALFGSADARSRNAAFDNLNLDAISLPVKSLKEFTYENDEIRRSMRNDARSSCLSFILNVGALVVICWFLYAFFEDQIRPKHDRSAPESKVHDGEVPATNAITNTIGMRLTLIPAGSFEMGSPDSDKDAVGDEKPRHAVRISRAFYLGVHEVTQEQYEKITGSNPSIFSVIGGGKAKVRNLDTRKLPVEQVSWLDAVACCNALSVKEGLPAFYTINGKNVGVPDWNGKGYRLPTEAEWEYSCRAGKSTRYSFGDESERLGEFAWFGVINGQTQPVGAKLANAFGLHDMHGNVYEWCWDGYAKYEASEAVDPHGPGPADAPGRVMRGGDWELKATEARSACRAGGAPHDKSEFVGFRVARFR